MTQTTLPVSVPDQGGTALNSRNLNVSSNYSGQNLGYMDSSDGVPFRRCFKSNSPGGHATFNSLKVAPCSCGQRNHRPRSPVLASPSWISEGAGIQGLSWSHKGNFGTTSLSLADARAVTASSLSVSGHARSCLSSSTSVAAPQRETTGYFVSWPSTFGTPRAAYLKDQMNYKRGAIYVYMIPICYSMDHKPVQGSFRP